MGAGIAVAGVSAYGFLVVAARALGPAPYGQLSALYGLAVLVGIGLFVPVEQEVARAASARTASGQGTGEVVGATARVAAPLLAAAVVALLLAWPLVGDRLFGGDALHLAGLVASATGYAAQYLARGHAAGTGRFGSYAALVALEGVFRLAGAAVLSAAGVDRAGAYGLAFGLGPLLATAAVIAVTRPRPAAGPPVPRRDVVAALAHLVGASVLAQAVLNLPLVAARALGAPDDAEDAGRFLACFVVARVPLFLFGAVQAALLPSLAAAAADGDRERLRRTVSRAALSTAIASAGAIAAAATVGPAVVGMLFGDEFRLDGSDLAWLAAGAGAHIGALVVGAALVSLRAYRHVAAGWAVGVVAAAVPLVVSGRLLPRLEASFFAGSLVALACMAVALRARVEAMPRDLEPGFAVVPLAEP